MFKGVLAMAHPPRHYHEYGETGGRSGPIVEERLPDIRDPIPFDRDEWVHFDLDLVNSEWLLFQDTDPLQDSKQVC